MEATEDSGNSEHISYQEAKPQQSQTPAEALDGGDDASA